MWRVDVPEEGLITEEGEVGSKIATTLLWSIQTFTPHLTDTLWIVHCIYTLYGLQAVH